MVVVTRPLLSKLQVTTLRVFRVAVFRAREKVREKTERLQPRAYRSAKVSWELSCLGLATSLGCWWRIESSALCCHSSLHVAVAAATLALTWSRPCMYSIYAGANCTIRDLAWRSRVWTSGWTRGRWKLGVWWLNTSSPHRSINPWGVCKVPVPNRMLVSLIWLASVLAVEMAILKGNKWIVAKAWGKMRQTLLLASSCTSPARMHLKWPIVNCMQIFNVMSLWIQVHNEN